MGVKSEIFFGTTLYTLIFIGHLLAGVTFVLVVCGNSNKKKQINKQNKNNVELVCISGPSCSNVGWL